ncbi:uncharacterized protein [Haliotis asinina]|uniref:uncharacterized protein n=1 Tax=Haliotis asinina TaxID=109174 RepID=UPI003531B752
MDSKKKTKTTNFSSTELDVLISGIEANTVIINSTLTNTVTNNLKKKSWTDITNNDWESKRIKEETKSTNEIYKTLSQNEGKKIKILEDILGQLRLLTSILRECLNLEKVKIEYKQSKDYSLSPIIKFD